VVLVILLTAFAVQMAVAKVWAQPYPAFFQPSFGGAVSPAGTTVMEEPTITVTYTDGTVMTVSHNDVMAKSQSLRLAVFTSAFSPDSPRLSAPGTVAWLGQRLTELGHGRHPARAVIQWREVTYDLGDRRPPRSATTDRTTITFGGERD
jgi:hypothetical protein